MRLGPRQTWASSTIQSTPRRQKAQQPYSSARVQSRSGRPFTKLRSVFLTELPRQWVRPYGFPAWCVDPEFTTEIHVLFLNLPGVLGAEFLIFPIFLPN